MRPATGAPIAIVLGAALMYLFDPVQGSRRRALARDRCGHLSRKAWRFANAAKTDVGNRLGGLNARVQRARQRNTNRDDVRLEQVRAALGRVVSHPGAVHVMMVGDVVRLDGAILAREMAPLLARIRAVDGVALIDNRLLIKEHGEGVPGLQGSGTTPRHSVRHALRAPGIQLTAIAAAALGLAAAFRLRRRPRPAVETNLELPFGGA